MIIKKMKKTVIFLVLICLLSAWLNQDTEASDIHLNVDEVTLYVPTDGLDMPVQQSYQFEVLGTNAPVTWRANGAGYVCVGGGSINISDTGLVTAVDEGEFIIRALTGRRELRAYVHVRSSADYYTENVIKEFLESNITSDMTQQQQLEKITEYVASTSDYSAEYTGGNDIFIQKKGDCWASTNAIIKMCHFAGMHAAQRIARDDPNAGSGHRNALVEADGKYFIADAGYVGEKPRYYSVKETDIVCEKYEVDTTPIEFTEIDEWEDLIYRVSIEPSALAYGFVDWKSENPDVAAIQNDFSDNTGRWVVAKGNGTTLITATFNNIKYKIPVTVSLNKEPDLSVSPDMKLPFTDVHEGDWYQQAAGFVYSKGIMTGMNDTEFGPSVKLSRAQFATILYRMEGEPETAYDAAAFPDVTEGQFYTKAAMWAKSTGIISGYEDGRFGPADEITREQMAVMMYRYANKLGLDTSAEGDMSGFPDAGQISPFAEREVKWAVGAGLIKGDGGNVNPQGTAERAQCATIIMRFMEGYGL